MVAPRVLLEQPQEEPFIAMSPNDPQSPLQVCGNSLYLDGPWQRFLHFAGVHGVNTPAKVKCKVPTKGGVGKSSVGLFFPWGLGQRVQ